MLVHYVHATEQDRKIVVPTIVSLNKRYLYPLRYLMTYIKKIKKNDSLESTLITEFTKHITEQPSPVTHILNQHYKHAIEGRINANYRWLKQVI